MSIFKPGFGWGGIQLKFLLHHICIPLQYYAESHGVIYVIDSTDEERLSQSKDAFGEKVTLWPELSDRASINN